MKTLSAALEFWLVINSPRWKPRTLEYYTDLVRIVTGMLPDVPVADLTDDHVALFAEQAGHYSASVWNGLLTMLRANVTAFRQLRRRCHAGRERIPPSQTQFSRLLAECDRLPRSRAGLVVNFLAHTGMRIKEARALRWQDVQADCIQVPGGITKSSQGRAIPIVNGLGDVLARLRETTGASGYVLPRAAIRRGLAKACARAGVSALTHHDFRHLFATRCIESGVDVPTVARWLGHRDGGALLSKRYFHLLDGHSRQMASRVRI